MNICLLYFSRIRAHMSLASVVLKNGIYEDNNRVGISGNKCRVS